MNLASVNPSPLDLAPMDLVRAGLRAEELLDDTLCGVRPAVAWQYGPPGALCRPEPSDGGALWTVMRTRNITTAVSFARLGALLGTVERHWLRRGWTLQAVIPDRRRPGMYARTPDGFQLSLDVGAAGNVYLGATSPPVHDASDARPHHPPGTPGTDEYPGTDGDLAPLPATVCPFWSAT